MPDEPADATRAIDAVLAALPPDQGAAMEALRRTIAAAAPGAVEVFSYGMPAFRYRGRALVAYGAFKAHVSLFPMSGAVMDALRVELAGLAASKGTIRITPDRPLSTDLVQVIVQARLAEIDAALTRSRPGSAGRAARASPRSPSRR
jgi:uncharacterized protein YdhG (YjbR/CyaY superfamily)